MNWLIGTVFIALFIICTLSGIFILKSKKRNAYTFATGVGFLLLGLVMLMAEVVFFFE